MRRLNNAYFFASVLLFRLILDFTYITFIQDVYAYRGFELNISITKYLESIITYILLAWISPKIIKKPSDAYILVLMLTIITPLSSLYALSNIEQWIFYYVSASVLAITILTRTIRTISIPYFQKSKSTLVIITFIIVIITFAWQLSANGLNNFNLRLTKVYDFRDLASKNIDVSIFAYINSWTTKVFNPLLLVYGLYKKNYIIIILSLLLQFMFFGISAKKAVLFYPMMIIGFWYLLRKSKKTSMLIFYLSAFLIVLLLVSSFSSDNYYVSLFIRRMFFSLGKNIADYFYFFQEYGHVYWSNSLMSPFINYPFDLPPAKQIAEWRNEVSHVNTSFIANGFMHAGIWGVGIYVVLVSFIFKLIDSLSKKDVPLAFSICITIIPVFQLITASDLTTALLTKGLGICLVALYLIRPIHENRT